MKKTAMVSVMALVMGLCLPSLWAAEVAITVIDAELGIALEGVSLQGAGLESARTDAEGRARLPLPEGKGRIAVTASLPGYEPAKLWVKAGDGALALKLAIAGVVEGKELVVERAKPQQTDEQAGVSQVATREEIKGTAELGIVEDLMSTIKLMPGVGYAGGWNAMPSIRGGDPSETTAVFDGAYVRNPYEWGGAFSMSITTGSAPRWTRPPTPPASRRRGISSGTR